MSQQTACEPVDKELDVNNRTNLIECRKVRCFSVAVK